MTNFDFFSGFGKEPGYRNDLGLIASYMNVCSCERAGIHRIIAWSPTSGEQSIISSHSFNRLSISRLIQNNDPVLGEDGEPLYLAQSTPEVRIVSVEDRLAEMESQLV